MNCDFIFYLQTAVLSGCKKKTLRKTLEKPARVRYNKNSEERFHEPEGGVHGGNHDQDPG